MSPLPATPFLAGVWRDARIFFVCAGKSIHNREIFREERKGHTRGTFGQSTSSSGSTQGSAAAAACHSDQAGNPNMASM
jgi:hypothetical protein